MKPEILWFPGAGVGGWGLSIKDIRELSAVVGMFYIVTCCDTGGYICQNSCN